MLNSLAVKWHADGIITEKDQEEIVAIVSQSNALDWKPLIFVIPFVTVEKRVQDVPRAARASHEPEFVIPDLMDGEFEIIEPIA